MTRLIVAPASRPQSPSAKQVALSPRWEAWAGQPEQAAAESRNEDSGWRRFLTALLRSLSAWPA